VSATEVVVVPTGTANLASVLAALERLGAGARLAEDAAMVDDAGHVVLPGVGSFGATMAGLREAGFRQARKFTWEKAATTFLGEVHRFRTRKEEQ